MAAAFCSLVLGLVIETWPESPRDLVLVSAVYLRWLPADGSGGIHRICFDDSSTSKGASHRLCICSVCSHERRPIGDIGRRRRRCHPLDGLAFRRAPKRTLGSGRFIDSDLGRVCFDSDCGFSRQPAYISCSGSARWSGTDTDHRFCSGRKADAVRADLPDRAIPAQTLAWQPTSLLARCTIFGTGDSAGCGITSLDR